MTYVWKCDECGRTREVRCSVEERDRPQFCCHARDFTAYLIKMRRLLSVPIVNADLEKDRPENQVGRVLAGGSSSTKDQAEAMRKSDRRYERDRGTMDFSKPKYTSIDDILSTGLHPRMTKEAVMNWRKAHIPKDDFAEASRG